MNKIRNEPEGGLEEGRGGIVEAEPPSSEHS